MLHKSCDLLTSFSCYLFSRKTRVADFNTSLLHKLACLSLSGLTRQSILYLSATQKVANAGEIKFLGN